LCCELQSLYIERRFSLETMAFETIDDLLSSIRMDQRADEIKTGGFVRQGQYYDKTLLRYMSLPMIVEPTHLGADNAITEPRCEIYTEQCKTGEILLTVLPLLKKDGGPDERAPIFALRNGLADYFLSANIGYLGYEEMSYPDGLTVLKSIAQFPVEGFNHMTPQEALDEARRLDFWLFGENSSVRYSGTRYKGWSKQIDSKRVTVLETDKGTKSRYDPMYFLAIHRTGSLLDTRA
jgi:hypothetical protein